MSVLILYEVMCVRGSVQEEERMRRKREKENEVVYNRDLKSIIGKEYMARGGIQEGKRKEELK